MYLTNLLKSPIKFFYAVFGDCPPSGQHTLCSPKCLQDDECTSMGGKCCPNLCNYRSCAIPKQGGNTDKYKGCKYIYCTHFTLTYFNTQIFPSNKASAGGGGHCGNVKCGAFEKCGTDLATKRPKCVRA